MGTTIYASEALDALAQFRPDSTPDEREQAIAPYVFDEVHMDLTARKVSAHDMTAVRSRLVHLMAYNDPKTRKVWRPCCII